MFEVGVKEAGNQLSDLEKRLKELVAKYGTMKIAVEIGNLDTFINALKTIGNGEQLKPLLDRIQTLQNRLGALGDKGQYFDMLRGNAAAAAKEVEKAEKYLVAMQKTGNTGFIASAKDSLQRAQVEATRANEMLASATERFAKEEERVARETNNTKARIDALGTSVTELHAKLGSGININFDTSKFSAWASEVQGVSLAVKELVEQLKNITPLDGLKTITTSAQSATNALKYTTEEIERQKNTVEKYEALLASRTRWVTNQREALSSAYYGLNIDGPKRLLDIEKERAQVLDQIKKKEKDLSDERQAYLKGRLSGISAPEKAVLRSMEKAYQFTVKMNAEAQSFKANIGKDAIYSLRSELQNLNVSNLSSTMHEVKDYISYLKEELKRLGSNSSIDTSGLQTLIQKAEEAYQAYKKITNEHNKALGKYAEASGHPSFGYMGAVSGHNQLMGLYAKNESLSEESRSLKYHLDKETESLEAQAKASQNLAQAKQKLNEMQAQNAQSAEKVAQATQQLNQAEQKIAETQQKGAQQGNLFDPQKFTSLQEAIDKIISEINRLKEAFSGIGKIEGLSQMTTDINGLMHNVNNLKDVLSTLSSAVKIDQSSPLIKKLTADAEAAEKKIQELTEKLNAMSAAQNKVAESVAKSGKSETQVTDSQTAMFNRYRKLMADIHNIKREIVDIQRSDGGGGALGAQLGQYFSALNRVRNEIAKITSAPSLAEAISRGMSSEMLSKLSSSLAAIKSEFKEVISGAKAFNKEFDKGSAQSEARIRKLGMAFNELKNYMKKNGGSEEMRKLQSEIQVAIQKMRQLMNAGDYSGAIRVFERMNSTIRQTSQAIKEYERSVLGAAASNSHLSASEQQLANSIKHSTDSMRSQSQVLGDLKTLATQYLGVWGAQGFLRNVIEIGGQLEQQRLSIGAILGDMAAGQHLFDQIKELALTSPFGVMELDKDTKQLSAYGFKQSELFDMTKRLADISAGAGTEVSRLALALGHVRSEGALTGYTLRQFAMNNIPMLQKLSERLTKLEGQIVSTAEIRKRVSKKEIGYEDVIAVIKDLTNEGGMFFNMQETMADAVNAKFKNLKDSMDIMYGEMAEGGIGSALKWVAETLMSLTRNWEKTARVIGYGTAAFVAYRLAITSANTQLLTYGSTLGATSKTLNAKAIALGVNTAAVKRLTADEVDELVTLKLVTREQLLNAVATKKLTVDQAELAAATFNVTRAELTSIASKGKLGIASAGLSLRLKGLALSLRGVGTALKTMLLNPVGIALMAITAGFEVFMRWKQKNSEIEESIERLGQKGSEGYKNIAATMEKYSGKDGKMSESEYSTAISDIIDTLKNYAPNIHNIQEEAQSIDNLAERYMYLRDELESTRNAYADLERTKAFASNANEATGNILNDTFTENVEEYIGKVQDLDKAEQELLQHRVTLDKTIGELERKTAFKRRMDSNGNALPLIEQLKYIKNTDWNKAFSPMLYSNSSGAAEAFSDFGVAIKNMSDTMHNEVLPDLQNFANRLDNQYSGVFGKNWKENADNIKTAWMAVVSEIDKVPGMTDSVKRELLEKIFNETWKMNIDFSTGEVTESLTGWRKEMQDWLDENGLKFRIGFNDSREDIYKKAKAAQEAAQTEMNNAGKVLISIGFKLDNLPKELPSPLQTPWNQKNLEDYAEQKVIDDTWEKFQKHFGADWQTKQDKTNAKKNNGRNDDKEAKRLREVVKLYKDAFDWYNKYEKQVGKGSALSKVQEQFKPLFDQFSDQFKQTLSLDSIPLYKENLESLLAEAEKLYQDPKHKNSYMVEAIKQIRDAINNVDFEELGNKQEEFLSKTQIQLDNLTRSWETFNSVRDATGNIELAVQLSGAGYQAGTNINLADALRKKIEGDFAAAGAIAIPFDINFSDEEIFNRISAAMPEKTQEQIKGIVEEYKKWRDLQRDVVKTDIQNFGKLLGSIVDYKSEIQKLNDEYNKQKEMLDALYALGMIDKNAYDKAMGIIATSKDDAIWQKSATYIDLMNHSLAMTKPEIDAAARAQEENLNARLTAGTIKAEDFYQEIVKLRKITTEWNTEGFLGSKGAFGSFVSGGNQGLMDYYDRRRNRAWRDYSNADVKDSPEAQEKLIEAQHYDKLYQSLAKLTDSAEDVVNAFQTLQGGVDLLGNLFDSLGMGSAATAMSDAGGLLSGALGGASSLSALGPYGMAAGAALGLATSIAELNDKGIQREIEALQDNVEALEANTNSIRAARERTLGYDAGVLRRAMSGLYEDTTKNINFFGKDLTVTSAAKKTMQEYYNAGTNKTGYAAELENLKEMRENYLEMYDKENSKKKTSNSALEEYKQKMAELDEQIMYFVEDLANELWGIDFKAWASQISDALWTAFENGESALDAFHDAAKDIISDVAKRMMNIHLIEPVFQQLEERLFGKMENGKRVGGAAYNYDTGEFNEKETLKILGEAFGENGEFAKVISAAEDFYNMAKTVTGFDFGEDSTGSRSSSAISKTITEEQSNLLIALVNTIRADVSVNRTMIAQYFPLYYQALTSGNETLGSIAMNTRAIMESNATIAQRVSNLDDSINGLKNKVWRLPVS